jgi:hypothetical protein
MVRVMNKLLRFFILPVLVYWTAQFSPDHGRTWIETRHARQFETPRELAQFILLGPQEGQTYACQDSDTKQFGRCQIKDLEVR